MRSIRASRLNRRRAATIVMVAVTLPVLLAMAALTIDVAQLMNVRVDLQNSADSAALAGVWALTTDDMYEVRLNDGDAAAYAQVLGFGHGSIKRVEHLNHSFGAKQTLIDESDVSFGWIDLSSATSDVDSTAENDRFNAVRVFVHRDLEGPNPPVALFFAKIFGKSHTSVSASAVAAFDDRVGAYDPGAGGVDLWPFTIHQDVYETELHAGVDNYEYDQNTESVLTGNDGLPELSLYPTSLLSGNRGLLHFGDSSSGTPNLVDDIENGVAPEDVEYVIGSSVLTFYDNNNLPITHEIDGTPGLKSSLEDAVVSRIGDVVAIPLYDYASGGGSGATYRITQVRFVRVMAAKLQGAKSEKSIWVQPVSYVGAGVIVNPNAPSTGGAAGRLMLVR